MKQPDKHSERLSQEQIDAAFAAMQQAFRDNQSFILQYAGKAEGILDKDDGSPVTDADVEVERRIQAAMSRQFPEMRVYGEESGYDDNLTGAFWLIDPIDGTKSFIQNIPAFTSMAVLIQDGEAIASAIYNITTGDMFTAQKGKGAFKNGQRLDLHDVPLAKTAIAKTQLFDGLNAIMQDLAVTCETGVAGGGFGFTQVADGKAAARFNILGGGYVHDYAPGALLVAEAGGAIIPVKDDEYTYESRSFVVCHPALEQTLRDNVTKLRQLEQELRGK